MKAKFSYRPYRLIPAAAALAGVLLATSSATATIIYNLGTLGGTDSLGHAVNHAGQVAGDSYTTDNAAYHAFRYDGTDVPRPGVVALPPSLSLREMKNRSHRSSERTLRVHWSHGDLNSANRCWR